MNRTQADAGVQKPQAPPPAHPHPHQPAVDIQILFDELRKIEEEIVELRSETFSSRPRRHSQQRSENHKPSKMKYCYYHHRYGMSAKNCIPPCSVKPVPKPSEN